LRRQNGFSSTLEREGFDMRRLETSLFEVAQAFIGIREIQGTLDNPAIMAMLKLDASWPGHDEVAWCSAFANYISKLLKVPRSKSLMARSWLRIGSAVDLGNAEIGSDIVILKRGGKNEPGPEVSDAPGHVGFYAGRENELVLVLGGNQGDSVNIQGFPVDQVLGIRRLY
jgi:uncharacterized protein (TIGR02594 family)